MTSPIKKYITATSDLNKAIDIGSIYIERNTQQQLRKLKKRGQLNGYEDPRFDFFKHEYQAHKKTLEELLTIAKKDLRIK